MSWFHKKSTVEKGRKKQIQSLMSYNGKQYNVSQISANEYKIMFRTRIGEQNFVLSLTDNFPESAPHMRTDGRYSHPWLDLSGNIIGCQGIARWNASSDLGRSVLECVQQFVASPPTLSVHVQPPSYQEHVHVSQHVKKQVSNLDMSSITLSIPKIIPQLEAKTDAELADMCNNPQLIRDFAFEVACTLREMKKQSQEEILRIARQNLSAKADIVQNEIECRVLESEIAAALQVFSNLELQQQRLMQKFSKERINQEIDRELEKLEAECESIKDSLDQKNIPPVTFCKEYRKVRQNLHCVSIKKEKFNALYGHK